MIEGVLRHCTDMEIQRQYVDSHGQTAVGFAFCHLLGFELAPRLKAIARQKLVLPAAGMRARLPNLAPILSNVVDWAEIEQQYDEMVKYAAAMQTKTADPEAILRAEAQRRAPAAHRVFWEHPKTSQRCSGGSTAAAYAEGAALTNGPPKRWLTAQCS